MNNNQGNVNSTIIEYEKVRQNAQTIKDCGKTLGNIFTDFNNLMTTIKAQEVLEGKAGDALDTSYQTLKRRFETYTSTVESFANMILNATASTESTEKAIASEMSNLPS